MTNLEVELVSWSKQQAGWQQDLLRRLASGEVLGSAEYRLYANAALQDEIVKCSSWYSSNELDRAPDHQPLTEAHLSATHADEEPVAILQVLHVEGANDLAPGASLDFEPTGLTIIAGKNGSGKSGYTRVIKQVAASRASERVLPNVFSPEIAPKAVVQYSDGRGGQHAELSWMDGIGEVESPVQRVRVFDSRSANVHLAGATEIAYVPPALQILGDYTRALQEISALIDTDILGERALNRQWPELESGIGKQIFKDLGAESGLRALESVLDLSASELQELGKLPGKISELTVSDPAKQAAQARQTSTQFQTLARNIDIVAEKIGPSSFELVRGLHTAIDDATRGVDEARIIFDEAGVLPGTGSESWQKMWNAAKEFADEGDHQHGFPVDFESCPLCVQSLTKEAQERLSLFAQFAQGEAQAKLSRAQALWNTEHSALTSLAISTLLTDELSDLLRAYDDELTDSLQTRLLFAESLRSILIASPERDTEKGKSSEEDEAAVNDSQVQGQNIDPASTQTQLKVIAERVRVAAEEEKSRAETLASVDSSAAAVKDLSSRMESLKLRREIAKERDAIGAQHDRTLRLDCLAKARSACGTTKASRKNSELSQEYVSAVCERFDQEAVALGLERVPVELQFDRSSRGVSYIKVGIKDAVSSAASEVLSEGEQRVTAIAGFFADLTASGDKSTLVFDDPVSSLDQEYRVKVAERLLEEALERQVLVFTHDFSFVQYLYEEKRLADRRRVAASLPPSEALSYLHIARSAEGAGVLTSSEVWRHVNVRERLGRLRARQQEAASIYRQNDMVRYEKELKDIVGALRETWELFVEQELLDGIVKRHERAVQTQRLSRILDLQDSDIAKVEIGMSVQSRYMTGHAAPISDGSAPQNPEWLKGEIDQLADLRSEVMSRRR